MALRKYTKAIEATVGQLRACVADDSSRLDAEAVKSDDDDDANEDDANEDDNNINGAGGHQAEQSAFGPLIAHFDAQPQRFATSLRRAITADDVRRVLRRQVVKHVVPQLAT